VQRYPSISDPDAAITRGDVLVDGLIVYNPASMVRERATIKLRLDEPLAKLKAAVMSFTIDVVGRLALDVGAVARGFTRVLLEAGVRRVYEVDAGHGQLLGSLRQDPRVTNLEATTIWRPSIYPYI
jgi:23S rRNA (cytidine1920-2'-O)/16S rRNA (cytidine1409-2'-O)-methyltransferase